jgi:glycosyltransferase involved in cell wall biosynthesis
MKILVAHVTQPGCSGGAEYLVNNLLTELRVRDHEVEYVEFPLNLSSLSNIPPLCHALEKIEIHNTDLVICTKFPATLIKHNNKITWLLHHFKNVDPEVFDRLNSIDNNYLHSFIVNKQVKAIKESAKSFVISSNIQNQIMDKLGVKIDVLRTPVSVNQTKSQAFDGNYIFCGGPINSQNRQDLLIKALSLSKQDYKLRIIGLSEDQNYFSYLVSLIKQLKLQDKVLLENRFLNDLEFKNLIDFSSLCVYIPNYEDIFSIFAGMACLSNKLVLTASDSGEVATFISQVDSRLVSENNPTDLSRKLDFAISELTTSPLLVKKQLEIYNSQYFINWDTVISELIC